MMATPDISSSARLMTGLESALAARGQDLAVFLVYERPAQVEQRPALARTAFAQRCVSDDQLDRMVSACRDIGAYVEVFDGEEPFVWALVSGRLDELGRSLRIVYNGIGFGITTGGFLPGRMALLPALADSFGIVCAHSDAFTCAFSMHRYHSAIVMRSLGVTAPPVWHYRPDRGWLGPRPPEGTKVIVKNTYEAWSVGVDDDSVFVVDSTTEQRAETIARRIGQPVTIERFVAGREVCVPVLAAPEPVVLPAIEQILRRAPGDPEAVFTMQDNLEGEAASYVVYDGAPTVLEQMANAALGAFEILQAQALGRMDFRIDADGEPWLTDAAVVPGLGASGAMFRSFETFGLDHASFIRIVFAANLVARGQLTLPS